VHYKLTYFNGRGLGETARQILTYAGATGRMIAIPIWKHGRPRS